MIVVTLNIVLKLEGFELPAFCSQTRFRNKQPSKLSWTLLINAELLPAMCFQKEFQKSEQIGL